MIQRVTSAHLYSFKLNKSLKSFSHQPFVDQTELWRRSYGYLPPSTKASGPEHEIKTFGVCERFTGNNAATACQAQPPQSEPLPRTARVIMPIWTYLFIDKQKLSERCSSSSKDKTPGCSTEGLEWSKTKFRGVFSDGQHCDTLSSQPITARSTDDPEARLAARLQQLNSPKISAIWKQKESFYRILVCFFHVLWDKNRFFW